MQTSQVFNQKLWPKAGDVDDCGYTSAIQLVNVVAPWVPLFTIAEVRAWAGDPDDGVNDASSLAEVLAAIKGIAPQLGKHCRIADSRPIGELQDAIHEGRPVSVAVISSRLPAGLRFGFAGSHQGTLAWNGGRLLFANPLAPVYSPWRELSWTELRPALETHAGAGKFDGVIGPTEAEAFRTHPLYVSQDAATRAGRVAGYTAARDAAAKIAADAAAAVGRLKP